jgi:hypothetical protein
MLKPATLYRDKDSGYSTASGSIIDTWEEEMQIPFLEEGNMPNLALFIDMV